MASAQVLSRVLGLLLALSLYGMMPQQADAAGTIQQPPTPPSPKSRRSPLSPPPPPKTRSPPPPKPNSKALKSRPPPPADVRPLHPPPSNDGDNEPYAPDDGAPTNVSRPPLPPRGVVKAGITTCASLVKTDQLGPNFLTYKVIEDVDQANKQECSRYCMGEPLCQYWVITNTDRTRCWLSSAIPTDTQPSSEKTGGGKCTAFINVALNKPATQFNRRDTSVPPSLLAMQELENSLLNPASNCNNGNLEDKCRSTRNFSPWWVVDLGATYMVSGVTITVPPSLNTWKMERVEIRVGNNPTGGFAPGSGWTDGYPVNSGNAVCYSMPQRRYLNGGANTIACNNRIMYGRYVSVQADMDDPLILAEVQVWSPVCTPGQYAAEITVPSFTWLGSFKCPSGKVVNGFLCVTPCRSGYRLDGVMCSTICA